MTRRLCLVLTELDNAVLLTFSHQNGAMCLEMLDELCPFHLYLTHTGSQSLYSLLLKLTCLLPSLFIIQSWRRPLSRLE